MGFPRRRACFLLHFRVARARTQPKTWTGRLRALPHEPENFRASDKPAVRSSSTNPNPKVAPKPHNLKKGRKREIGQDFR
ncbi:hypothetical protein L484_027165 [Morus notabilis]|uniref:Uncharacterized protein n=1 Tax=Morus notabilis TaxID=981085 RepID=W9SQA3_9ROSA|nr:hypothetical protein L484_027165 [Morus notabilis]